MRVGKSEVDNRVTLPWIEKISIRNDEDLINAIANFTEITFRVYLNDYVIFRPKTKDELVEAINLWCKSSEEAEKKYGHISIWNVSLITDMSNLFETRELDDDISSWDVSNVTNMRYMFFWSIINSPLDSWDVSSVKDMSGMFRRSNFNRSIQSWDVRNVTTMEFMFAETFHFNQDLNHWRVQSVTNMDQMFSGAEEFNQPLDRWNVSQVTTLVYMFKSSPFNKSLKNWDLSTKDIFGIFMDCYDFNFQENINFDNWDNFSVTIFKDIVGCHEDNYLEYDFDDVPENEDTPSYSDLNTNDMENFHRINIYIGKEKHRPKFQNVLLELKSKVPNYGAIDSTHIFNLVDFEEFIQDFI